jgi:hypothetical protein
MPNKLQKQPRSDLVWQHVPQFVKIEGFFNRICSPIFDCRLPKSWYDPPLLIY